jgi:hypothetical protein
MESIEFYVTIIIYEISYTCQTQHINTLSYMKGVRDCACIHWDEQLIF